MRSKKTTVSLSILHSNPRGWFSKQESVLKLVELTKPTIVNLNETQMNGENKPSIEYYTSFPKNRPARISGGICTAVHSSLKEQTVCVAEGEEEDEWLTVRLTHISPPLTLVNCYREQEGSSNRQQVVDRWGRLLQVLEAGRARGDHVLLLGDLNKHIGNGHLGVQGNTGEISTGGRLIRDLVNSGDWRLINAMED